MVKCNICGGNTQRIEVKEKMLGLGEKFDYFKCLECGHTHLEDIPAKLDKYYNSQNYYSFNAKNSFEEGSLHNSSVKLKLKRLLINLNIKNSFLSSAALKAFFSIKGLSKQDKILDYGCGSGHFVKELIECGYTQSRGYDLFLPKNISVNNEVYLSNDLNKLNNSQWDIISLNHVFEHMPDPVGLLKELKNILSNKGKVLLRFPVIDSFAFEKYQQNWVQFDAPRHLNIFTRKSIKIAVEKAGGYLIENMYDDSFHFQFTGSDLYENELSLKPKDNNFRKRLFSAKAYKYHFLAKKLNKQNKGDQIVIILESI